jgi:hypothetical protein
MAIWRVSALAWTSAMGRGQDDFLSAESIGNSP